MKTKKAAGYCGIHSNEVCGKYHAHAKQAAHTPGPWEVRDSGLRDKGCTGTKTLVYAPGRDWVVAHTAYGYVPEGEILESEANARLIAAAPETASERDRLKEINKELLEAAKEALLATVCFHREASKGCRICRIHLQLRPVIAKAEGR